MSDLVKRLRGLYSCGPDGVREDRDFGTYTPPICVEAADEIEALRARVAELEAGGAASRKKFESWILSEWGSDFHDFTGFGTGRRNNDWSYADHKLNAVWLGYLHGATNAPQPVKVLEAFELGWSMAADWADREDLLTDIGSPAYKKERDAMLKSQEPNQ